jgi:hypothetical protein
VHDEDLVITMLRTQVAPAQERTWWPAGGGAARFRQAAAALADVPDATSAGSPHARDAAEALLHLARAGQDETLGTLLRPDPLRRETTWTVACYRIGDLVPSELRDFASAAEAVLNLASCADPSHVAAELVASTPGGVRWTAVYRTGRTLIFQLPSREPGGEAPDPGPGGGPEAAAHWLDRLRHWRADPEADDADPVVPATGVPATDVPSADVPASDGVPAEVVDRLGELERRVDESGRAWEVCAARLERIERLLAELVEAVRSIR